MLAEMVFSNIFQVLLARLIDSPQVKMYSEALANCLHVTLGKEVGLRSLRVSV